LKKFSSMQDIYLTDQSRAVVYTDGMCLGLQMPMLLESSDHNVVGMNLVRWEAPTTKNICVPEVMSEETKTKTKTEAKAEETKTETKTEVKEGTTPEAPAPAPVDEKPAEAPAPVKEEVCATPASKGSEALIDGKWVPVTVLTTNGTRAMVRKENGQRAIVKLSEIRGNIVDNTADAPKPVCETKTKTKTEETKTDAEAPAAVAEATGTKYADEKVYIKQYSEKSFILTGNTMPYHKQLKKYGSWWRKKEAWIFSNKRREFVEKLIGENLIEAA